MLRPILHRTKQKYSVVPPNFTAERPEQAGAARSCPCNGGSPAPPTAANGSAGLLAGDVRRPVPQVELTPTAPSLYPLELPTGPVIAFCHLPGRPGKSYLLLYRTGSCLSIPFLSPEHFSAGLSPRSPSSALPAWCGGRRRIRWTETRPPSAPPGWGPRYPPP